MKNCTLVVGLLLGHLFIIMYKYVFLLKTVICYLFSRSSSSGLVVDLQEMEGRVPDVEGWMQEVGGRVPEVEGRVQKV